MKSILIDHGCNNNLGDLAMLESILCEYTNLPDVQTYVVQHNVDPNPISRTLYTETVARPDFFAHERESRLAGARFFWRYAGTIKRARLSVSLIKHCLNLGNKNQLAQMKDACARFDAVHFVGGGYLNDRFPGVFARKVLIADAFARCDKPVYFSGQQIGPFRSLTSTVVARRMLSQASFVGLRDNCESRQFCESCGISAPRFEVLGDDSFGLEPLRNEEVDDFLALHDLMRGEFLVANLRVAKYSGVSRELLERFGRFLVELSRVADLPILLVPIARQRSDDDLRSAAKIQAFCGSGRVIAVKDRGLSARLTKGVIGASRGAIGGSYHFCLFALCQSVPAIALYSNEYYKHKSRGLAALFSLDPSCVMPVSEVRESIAGDLWQQLSEGDRGLLEDASEKAVAFWRRGIRRNILDKIDKSEVVGDCSNLGPIKLRV